MGRAVVVALLLLAAPVQAQTRTATTGAAWREGLWRETAILNEGLLVAAEARLEAERKAHNRTKRSLRLAEQLAERTPVRVERVGPSPFVWVGVGLAIVGAGAVGFALGRTLP